MIRFAAIGFAVLGLIAAVIAANFWWRASRVPVAEPVQSIGDVPEIHILRTKVTFNESSRLNSIAAIWTGIAAVLSATGSVIGVL